MSFDGHRYYGPPPIDPRTWRSSLAAARPASSSNCTGRYDNFDESEGSAGGPPTMTGDVCGVCISLSLLLYSLQPN